MRGKPSPLVSFFEGIQKYSVDICRNCQSFFHELFDESINVESQFVRPPSSPLARVLPASFFPSFGGSNYFSFTAFPYIRSTKPSNWIPTVTYNRVPRQYRQNLYSFLLLNIHGNEDKCVGPGPANCRDTAPTPLLSSICRLSKYHVEQLRDNTFRSPLSFFHSFSLSRIVFFFLFMQKIERLMNFD